MNRIKLLVEGHLFDGPFQGSRTFLKGIFNELIRTSSHLFDIYVAAHDIENLKKNFPGLPSSNLIRYRFQNRYTRLGFELPAIIRKYKIDYAHFTYVTPFIKNCKFIVTTHDVIFNDFPDEFPLSYRIGRNLFFWIGLKGGDIITTLSEFSRKSIARTMGVDYNKIAIVTVGIENKFFELYNRDQSKEYILKKFNISNYILYVSRIEPRKNHLFLLNAFLELELYKKNMHLVLPGKESIPVKAFTQKLNNLPDEIKKYVHRFDFMDDQDLLEFYRGAELFVYPSKGEGFGIPPIEAAALKVKTMCANTSSMSDFSFFGKNSFDPFDYPAFVEKMKTALEENNPDELGKIAAHIRNTYTWEKAAKVLEQLILSNA